MTFRLLIALFAFLLPGAVLAQDVEGTWDLRLDGTAIFRFHIEEGDKGEWSGTWSRPGSFTSDGDAFGTLRGPVEMIESMAGNTFNGSVELSFDDPRPGAIPDIFRFERVGEDTLRMTYVGTDLAPYRLVRVQSGETFGDWDPALIYRRTNGAPTERDDFAVREVVEKPARPPMFNLDFSLDGEAKVLPDVPSETVTIPDSGSAALLEGEFSDAFADKGPVQEEPDSETGASVPADSEDATAAESEKDREDQKIAADFLDGF